MPPAQTRKAGAEPVEKFRPTSGRGLGLFGLTMIAVLVAYIAANEHTVTGLRVGTGLSLAAVLVWVTQLRPRVTAYPDALYLHNSLRDVVIPLVAIDEVSVGRMFNVWVGKERHICVGIGRPLRGMVKKGSRGPSSLLGFDRLEDYTERSTPPRPDQSAMSYPDYVEVRVNDMVRDAKRHADDEAAQPRPRHVWAWPEVVALAGTGAAFVLSLFA